MFAPWVFVLSVLAAVGILGWQAYSHLRIGSWPALSVVTLLEWLKIDWAHSPRDWIGLHALLAALPLSLVALATGVAAVVFWLRIGKREDAGDQGDWGG